VERSIPPPAAVEAVLIASERQGEPGPGQKSVWDYPRPARAEEVSKQIRVVLNGVLIGDTVRAKCVLETSHPPVYYVPAEDVRLESPTGTARPLPAIRPQPAM
jgi:uncharacterized protein (DUF427 family)